MEQTISKETQRDIVENWMTLIFENLKRLEFCERLALEGCSDIIQYITIPNPDMTTIRHKNYSLFMTEFSLLLGNAKNIMPKETYQKAQVEFMGLKLFEKNCKGFLRTEVNEAKHKKWYVFKPEFFTALDRLPKLRMIVIDGLWKILSPSMKGNFEEIMKRETEYNG